MFEILDPVEFKARWALHSAEPVWGTSSVGLECSPWCRLCIENDTAPRVSRFLQKQIRLFERFPKPKEFWKSVQNLGCFALFREIWLILGFSENS